MSLYTNNVPQAVQTIAETQPLIQDNFAYLASSIGVDHNFLSNSATASDGYHKVIHFVNQGGDPAPIAGVTQLYTKDSGGINELFELDSTGKLVQMTGLNVASKYAWVNGLLFQWGFKSMTVTLGQASGTVTFNTPFPVGVFVTQATCTYVSGSPPGGSNSITIATSGTPLTTFEFQYNGSSQIDGFRWLAIGY